MNAAVIAFKSKAFLRRALIPWRSLLIGLVALLLAACSTGSMDMGSLFSDSSGRQGAAPGAIPQPPASGAKVALLLPLGASGEPHASPGDETGGGTGPDRCGQSGVTLLTKDIGGSAQGAQTAAQAAIAKGAELILGPLLAPEVQAGRRPPASARAGHRLFLGQRRGTTAPI